MYVDLLLNSSDYILIWSKFDTFRTVKFDTLKGFQNIIGYVIPA